MTLSTSDLFQIRDIPSAGRGVLALRHLPTDTPILSALSPAAHVIFREYRKEVCGQCFHYDRGRTLPVRNAPVGKVFCSEECQQAWREEEGDVGVEAWRALEAWVKSRSSAVRCTATSQQMDGKRPASEDVQMAWEKAATTVAGMYTSNEESKKENSTPRKNLQKLASHHVDPDILGYLLSGILTVSKHPKRYHNEVLALAMDSQAYKSSDDLQSHCDSYVQLSSILPKALLQTCTPSICQSLIDTASHNSFGIRAGSEEDMEEYMGYSLYPDASYFNHSCAPNLAKKRLGRTWEFRTYRDVQEGEELCISYLGGDEASLDISARRERLERTWGFMCRCAKCRAEAGKR